MDVDTLRVQAPTQRARQPETTMAPLVSPVTSSTLRGSARSGQPSHSQSLNQSPRVQSLLHLQRRLAESPAGAEQRQQAAALQRAHAAEPVQLYRDESETRRVEGYSDSIVAWAKKFQRSSANLGIFQVSEKKVYARDDIIDAGEATLSAQGSFVQLVKGERLTEGYSQVRVRFRESKALAASRIPDLRQIGAESAKPAEARKDAQIAVIDALIGRNEGNIGSPESSERIREASVDANKSMAAEREVLVKLAHPGADDMFLTIRDCHKTARLIMGDFGATEEKILFSDVDGTFQRVMPKPDDKVHYVTVGQQGAVAFLKFAFSKFGGVLETAPARHPALESGVRAVAASWNYSSAMNVYQQIQADPVAGPLFNSTFHVNDEARVAVGQALVQVNDENERKGSVEGTLIDRETGKVKDLWNFHWAGVILSDGSDYLTLQAVADQMASDLTVNWWFKLYGVGAQSFHAEEKQDPHVGSRPITLSVATEARQQVRRGPLTVNKVD